MLVLVAVAAAGCGGDRAGANESDQRAIGAYTATIRWMLATDPIVGSVYVEPAGDDEIPLEVQTGVINELEDVAKIRFIDDRAEALATSDAAGTETVKGDGMLIALGALDDPIQTDPDRVVLYAERFDSSRELEAFRVVTVRSGKAWRVDTEPILVTVRPRPAES